MLMRQDAQAERKVILKIVEMRGEPKKFELLLIISNYADV